MRRTVRPRPELRLLGGSLPLDFVNSVDWRASEQPVEYLTDYDALVAWSRRVGTLSEAEAAALRARAATEPAAAESVTRRVRRRREQLYALLAGIASGRPADPALLDAARRWHGEAVEAGVLHQEAGRIVLSWRDERLDRPAWPLYGAAWDLLTGPALQRCKMCPADGCGWLFLDRSKNGSRRWCSMDGCGARMKMRAAYYRSRS
jgi:predicted RNA-binding Zn ribbon-like protein